METKQANLVFSVQPGCRERHLKRKYLNPLFSPRLSVISQSDVDQARSDDLDEYKSFIVNFDKLLSEVSCLSSRVETEIVLDLRVRVDALYDQWVSFGGGDADYKNALLRLHSTLVAAIKKSAENDIATLNELAREQKAHEIHLHLVEYPLVSDLLRADSPIEENELVQTLLSEDAESVQIVMSLFEPDQQQVIRDEARTWVERINRTDEVPERVLLAYQAMLKHKQ